MKVVLVCVCVCVCVCESDCGPLIYIMKVDCGICGVSGKFSDSTSTSFHKVNAEYEITVDRIFQYVVSLLPKHRHT